MKKCKEWIHGQGRKVTLLVMLILGIGIAVHYFVVERNGQWGSEECIPTVTPKSREEQNIGGDVIAPAPSEDASKPKDKKAEDKTKEQRQKDSAITIGFAGDICLDDSSAVMRNMKRKGGLKKVISPSLISKMRHYDFMVINNEFSISANGKPMEGKKYTFRSKPENVKYLKALGVDVAGLANNHVFDYGKQAFYDTMQHLKQAGIETVGAGKNSAEAGKPVILQRNGKKIAIVAATRAEKYVLTPGAKKNSPGVFRTYHSKKYVKAIKKAKKEADYVIAYVHWGTEYSTQLEEAQITQGKEYINAGADVIIGAHTHCMQGVGFYRNKPIFYSLGNFWFNARTLYTTIVELKIEKDGKITAKMLPCIQKGMETRLLTNEKRIKEFVRYINRISTNAKVTYQNAEQGIVPQQKKKRV